MLHCERAEHHEMSSTTTQHPDGRASAGVDVAPDEPEFQVRFTLEDPTAPRSQPPNSFHWIGAGTLRIGQRGVTIVGRRRGLMWIARDERRFIPSSEIRNVYREADAIRIELRELTARKQFFRFWAGSLKAAATIVALLPTARTVEIDEPAARIPRFATPTRPRQSSLWLPLATLGAIAVVVAVGVTLRQPASRPTEPRSNAGAAAPLDREPDAAGRAMTARRPSDAETFRARSEFDRFDPRFEGLSMQFAAAFEALQTGTLEQEDFASGLETWVIPQWRTLQGELAAAAPAADSADAGVHEALFATAIAWERALASYSAGLREHDSARVESAFAEMKRAEDSERLAWHRLQRLEVR